MIHKLEVKLKQHTPLIHFQHDQEGATLRASEVKPKLDKFILSLLTREEKARGQSEGWIKSKNDRTWLDYSLLINATGQDHTVHLSVIQRPNGRYVTDEFPFLLANMGGKASEEELMNFSMFSDIKMVVKVTHDTLFAKIKESLAAFFATNNFGQRKTKGFGSFSVKKIRIDNQDWQNVVWDINSFYENGTYCLSFPLSGNTIDQQRMLFGVIDFYWRCLKSGINYTRRRAPYNGQGDARITNKERYLKSYLWTYLNGKQATWEKRKLKQHFTCLATNYPVRNYDDNQLTPIFARGLMGCPDKYEYRVPQNSFAQNNRGIWREDIQQFSVNITNEYIERIASPIYFKPILQTKNNGVVAKVYILFDDLLVCKLNNLLENQRMFNFKLEPYQDIQIPIDPTKIDYKDLIKTFHLHLFSNTDYTSSLWGQYVNNGWTPAVLNKSKDKNGKIVRKLQRAETNAETKFIPRNFQWNNILDPENNSYDKFVSISVVTTQ